MRNNEEITIIDEIIFLSINKDLKIKNTAINPKAKNNG